MTSIAGSEIGLLRGVDELTPEWLTEVLWASGALAADASVASATTTPFAEGIGFLSYLYRVDLTYQGSAGDAPATVIVKFPTDVPEMRGIADGLAFYQRELRFYRELADRVPFRTAAVHAAAMADDGSDFVLVMEDLSSLRSLDQAAGVTGEEAVLAARTLAAFHAGFWGTDLSDLETTFLPLDNPVHRAVLPQIFASGWEQAKVNGRDLLTDEIVAFGDRFSELLPWALEQMSTGTTLVHGDWRADNLLVDGGELAALDFQIMGTAAGAYDLAYFMSQSMEPGVRRTHGAAVIDNYFDTLAEAGVTVDREAEERVLRVATAFCLIYPVATFAGWDALPENSREMSRSMLQRCITAAVDLDALSLLP